MKKLLFITLSILLSQKILATPRISEKLTKDMFTTLSFYYCQNGVLDDIKRHKKALLSNQIVLEQNEFNNTFAKSVFEMEKEITKIDPNFDFKTYNKKSKQICVNKAKKMSPQNVLDVIKNYQSQVKITRYYPVLETLLMFYPDYQKYPKKEFLDHYYYKYTSDPKTAKGINFSIKIPNTWKARDGNHPNVVKKFTNENGRGLISFVITIKNYPLSEFQKEGITNELFLELLKSEDIFNTFISSKEKYIDSGSLGIANLPAIWLKTSLKTQKMRTEIEADNIHYIIIYKDKIIDLFASVPVSINNIKFTDKFSKYEPLFDLIVNSLVINDLYK